MPDEKDLTGQTNPGGDPQDMDNNPNTQPEDNAHTPERTGQETGERLFTQAELNRIVQERLETERKGQPTKEELEAYRAYKAQQAEDEQEGNPDPKPPAEGALSEEPDEHTQRELEELRAQVAALKLNAAPETLKDVITLAMARVTKDKDIDKAIAEVMEQYPSFQAGNAPPPKDPKRPALLFPQDNKPPAKGTNEIMNQLFRQKKGG